jgi:Flp pilus assembly protein TadB
LVLKKGLVAAIGVIVLVGAFFLWREQRERVERAERIERARTELFDFAQAEAHETDKARQVCLDVKARWAAGESDSTLERILERCRDFEYVK